MSKEEKSLALEHLLDDMWRDYIKLNGSAQKIVDLLKNRGDEVVNDHIALRTFNHKRVSIDVIARPFLDSGYKECGDYHFDVKKLYAKHYEHPDPKLPKIFISELLLEEFSKDLQHKVNTLIDQVDDDLIKSFNFTCAGRPWKLSSSDYLALQKESEYAAWLSAIGFRPNHFTVFVNALNSIEDLTQLNKILKDAGFELNSSGGEIKGSKEAMLEQSSTLADKVEIEFSDKALTIPSCYFEFAKRYEDNKGELYQGFIVSSADKIFESTDS